MKQVKIRFTTHDGLEYGPGQSISDEIASQYPEFVKESPIVTHEEPEVIFETKPANVPKKETKSKKKATKKSSKKKVAKK